MDTNETPPAGPSPEPTPQQDQPRPAGDGFFTWLRGVGINRPGDRWFGGVAAGIANRAGIDPLIVRGIFIALTIVGGPGILLYAIGWFLLPDEQGRIEAERLVRGNGSGLGITIASVIGVFALLAIFGGLGGLFSNGIRQWDLWGSIGIPQWIPVLFTVLWWLLLIGGIAWITLLIIARGNPKVSREETERKVGAWGERTAKQATEWGNSFSEKAGAWGEQAGTKAGAWGAQAGEGANLAAAHVAGWTEREQAEHRRSRLDPAHTILTLGAALLAGGAAAVIASNAGLSALLAGSIAAVAVLGLSLIVAGLRGRRSGWLGFWSFAGIVAMLWVAFVPANSQFVPFGDIDTRVTSLGADTSSGIGLLAGESTVDLRDLTATGGTLDVWVVAGTAEVLLPERNVPVRVEARTLAGQQITIDRAGNETTLSSPLLVQTTGIAARPGDDTPVTTVRVWVLAGNTTIDGVSEMSGLSFSSENRSPQTLRAPDAPLILEDTR